MQAGVGLRAVGNWGGREGGHTQKGERDSPLPLKTQTRRITRQEKDRKHSSASFKRKMI